MSDTQVAQSETPEQIASRITRRWGSQYRTQLQAAIVEALRNERERCAKVAETHSATDCDGPDCGVVIARAIREGR